MTKTEKLARNICENAIRVARGDIDVFSFIYKWCGSAYCLASEDHKNGDCACDDNGRFDTTHLKPCCKENCPIYKDWKTLKKEKI